jgi:shikimate kinase
MNVYLIGAMGSGKSTTGKKLAAKLGWSFRDTDTMIEATEGISIGEYFSTFGEEAFRRIETQIIEELACETNLVVACGGGTPCFVNNMELMKQTGVVVYLMMTPEALIKRLEPVKASRPLIRSLEGEYLLEKISLLLKEREEIYKQAHIIISGLSVNLNGLIESVNSFFKKTN